MCFLCRNQTNGCFAAKEPSYPRDCRNLLNNRLVLITPRNAPALTSFQTDSEVRRIAIGEPKSVPAGICSGTPDKFENFDCSNRNSFTATMSVRFDLLETGNVDAGIVYITDQRIQICQGGGNGTGKFTFTNLSSSRGTQR